MNDTAKIKATKIEILFTEAGDDMKGTFGTWNEADARLVTIIRRSQNLGGAYHKTHFRVTWENGETYEGRIDVDAQTFPSIARHMREYCELHSGRCFPAWRSKEEWESYLDAYVSAEKRALLGSLLDGYQLGNG